MSATSIRNGFFFFLMVYEIKISHVHKQSVTWHVKVIDVLFIVNNHTSFILFTALELPTSSHAAFLFLIKISSKGRSFERLKPTFELRAMCGSEGCKQNIISKDTLWWWIVKQLLAVSVAELQRGTNNGRQGRRYILVRGIRRWWFYQFLNCSCGSEAAFHHGQFLSGINFPVTSLNKSGDVPPCVTGTRRREASSSGDDVRVLSVLQTDGRLSVS